MLRFLRSRLPHQTDAKQHERDEYFDFKQTLHHGFPTKASCMAYDPSLNLLAIATKLGHIRVYGAPGFELSAIQPNDKPVRRLTFVPNQGRLIAQCDDQSFYLWEINSAADAAESSVLELVTSVDTDDRLKTISALLMLPEGDTLLIGTESGNVYGMSTETLALTDHIIYQDQLAQSVPDEFKSTAGAVECLSLVEHSLLIGYTRGLIALWDTAASALVHAYATKQSVECVSWHGKSASRFISSHNDGSYVEWSADDASKPVRSPNIPFGPFPCKPIDKIVWKTTSTTLSDETMLIFTGGMPRASFGDRHTVSVQRGADQQIVFDLSSRVLDVVVVDANYADSHTSDPHTLLVLCEEELVAIDLLSDGWPMFTLPYLWPLHASPITACHYVNSVPNQVMDALLAAGQQSTATGGKCKLSSRDWPIQGGKLAQPMPDLPRQLLFTGHEDGNVRVWTADSVCMRLVHSLQVAAVFTDYLNPHEGNGTDEDDWPPFRRCGHYDPFSDDPRYGVQRLAFDAGNGVLTIGCNAGQVLVCSVNATGTQEVSSIPVVSVDIVDKTDQDTSFTWKGEPALTVRSEPLLFDACFTPDLMVQVQPPAAITAVAYKAQWNTLAIGTAHGFAVVDTKEKTALFTQCLLNADDMAAHNSSTLEATMTRFKSFKKSLRDSFRRRRRHAANEAGATASPSRPGASNNSGAASPAQQKSPRKSPLLDEDDDDVKPVERQIESRSEQPEGLSSLVRCVCFAQTHLTSASELVRSLWVGTNGGAIRAYIINEPSKAAATTETPAAAAGDAATTSASAESEPAAADVSEQPVAAAAETEPAAADTPADNTTTDAAGSSSSSAPLVQLAKEIQLQHGAPVLAVYVLDESNTVVQEPKQQTGTHRVLIVSEEQLKAFALPSLKPCRHKYKLTATEGARIRKNQLITLPSNADKDKSEHFLLVMSNQGELNAFELHNLRRYFKQSCLQAADVHGILSTILNEQGEVLSLTARGSEWQRFAANSRVGVQPQCSLPLPDGVVRLARKHRQQPAKPDEGGPDADKKPESGDTTNATSGDSQQVVPPSSTVQTTGGELDQSASSAGNTSAMPTDITVDSIRDYTNTTTTTTTIVTEPPPRETAEEEGSADAATPAEVNEDREVSKDDDVSPPSPKPDASADVSVVVNEAPNAVAQNETSSGGDGPVSATNEVVTTTFNTSEQGDCVIVETKVEKTSTTAAVAATNGHGSSNGEAAATNGQNGQAASNGHSADPDTNGEDRPDEDEIAKLKDELKEKMAVSPDSPAATA